MKQKHSWVCTSTYCPLSDDITSRLERWHHESYYETSECVSWLNPACQKKNVFFSSDPLLFSHGRSRNIRALHCSRRTLIPIPLKWNDGRLDQVIGFYHCWSCTIHVCDSCNKVSLFSSSDTGIQSNTIKQLFTRGSPNVIYLSSCRCNKQYMGRTSRQEEHVL